jgi:hypothetical protein
MQKSDEWHVISKGSSSKKPLTEKEKKKVTNLMQQTNVQVKVSYLGNEAELL